MVGAYRFATILILDRKDLIELNIISKLSGYVRSRIYMFREYFGIFHREQKIKTTPKNHCFFKKFENPH